ncbi:SAG-related sequence [Besnoitia besnoiti]|uniref:SAG-related sequence n=1 Tax=Besnoitia besnoiti TaxID=94643 RepID=A0A2A9ME76_BESBE|nr:SAG-related sequence [Besnoitia besnoiti]PFH36818.1 SAG-related sequence [Besnoitia besnoiti]
MRISSSQNSFTLLCRDKGQIVQTNYQKSFCPVSDAKGTGTNCNTDCTTTLPGYKRGWWTGDRKKGFTFTVPKDDFPQNEANFMVECQKGSTRLLLLIGGAGLVASALGSVLSV